MQFELEFDPVAVVHLAAAFVLAPLLLGVIHRVKARFAGRQGQPLLQPYRELARLVRKGAVYSRTTGWVFRLSPIVAVAAPALALALIPAAGHPAVLGFPGDLVLFAYLFGLARFMTVLGALDTGSAFEGMGASREVQFSALAEPALFLGLAVLVRRTHELSLSGIYGGVTPELWGAAAPELLLVAMALAVIVLSENSRIPFDDPNTHLELTMIHEVMVLDHGGPDFAAISYGAALKLWALGALLVGLAVPVRTGSLLIDAAAFIGGMLGLAVGVGMVESLMARLRLVRVPQLLIGAGALAALALVLSLR